MDDTSIVEYFPGEEAGSCGYCKSQGSISRGMWTHSLTVDDYQALLDRGWRRSGKYTYKPSMSVTCCPLYTIRCIAKEFHPSKGQKKVAKKIIKYLKNGEKVQIEEGEAISKKSHESSNDAGSKKSLAKSDGVSSEVSIMKKAAGQKKAKVLRLERKQKKLSNLKPTKDSEKSKTIEKSNIPKALCDLIPSTNSHCDSSQLDLKIPQVMDVQNDDGQTDFKHKLELRLVKADQEDKHFKEHFEESYAVYKNYQMMIHKDKEYECDKSTFRSFLCDSPLIYEERNEKGSSVLLGAFHQHYLIDGKIVAVGVIDILPKCVSSVYLYYHPGYGDLSLGTYSALREIQLVQQLAKHLDSLQYYYMGYYVHSCAKMRYKGRFLPSDLLSPVQSNTWHDITQCTPLLDIDKFTTFADLQVMGVRGEEEAKEDVGEVMVFTSGQEIKYRDYLALSGARDESEVKGYLELVGQEMATRLRLYRRFNSRRRVDTSSEESDSD